MRSGKLLHFIEVQRATDAVNEYGAPVRTWAYHAKLRAERVEQSTEEYLRAAGAVDETAIVFRTRYMAGITNADRILFQGSPYNIRVVTVIGRNKGLEFRCTAIEDNA